MNSGGWVIMLLSVGGVTAFFLWTLFMVLTRKPGSPEIHSTLDEPPDIDEDL